MIPQRLVDFIHGSVVMLVGARNAELRPAACMVSGAMADGEAGTITFFLPDAEGEQILSNFKDNGLVALTVAEGVSHETYQFKGKYIDSRPSEKKDAALQEIYRSKLSTRYGPGGLGEEFWRGVLFYPSTTVTFEVEEVFVQTPGPGAGEKLDLSQQSA